MYEDIFESIRKEAEKHNLRERTIKLYCTNVSYFLPCTRKPVPELGGLWAASVPSRTFSTTFIRPMNPHMIFPQPNEKRHTTTPTKWDGQSMTIYKYALLRFPTKGQSIISPISIFCAIWNTLCLHGSGKILPVAFLLFEKSNQLGNIFFRNWSSQHRFHHTATLNCLSP